MAADTCCWVRTSHHAAPRRLRARGSRMPLVVFTWLLTTSAHAAVLPAHDPMRVLIVADEVNPHGLAAEQLTQPSDFAPALKRAGSGLNLQDGDATSVDSQCVDSALEALNATPAPHVLLYFAHRAVRSCGGQDQQEAFTTAVTNLLTQGGGVVVLHHGGYESTGKAPLLQLLGVTAGSIEWNTQAGQRVFNLAPDHFITTNGVSYTGDAALTGDADIPSGMFSYFDNIPDERYPKTTLLFEQSEDRTLLFGTDSGPVRALGYALQRPGWAGHVVFYQPAEYQPNALDSIDGPNFQILVNALYFASGLGAMPAAADAGSDPSPMDAGATPASTASPSETLLVPPNPSSAPGQGATSAVSSASAPVSLPSSGTAPSGGSPALSATGGPALTSSTGVASPPSDAPQASASSNVASSATPSSSVNAGPASQASSTSSGGCELARTRNSSEPRTAALFFAALGLWFHRRRTATR